MKERERIRRICGIYALVDLQLNQIVYIGQSTHIYARMQCHDKAASNAELRRWLREVKPEHIDIWILCQCKPDELDYYELFYTMRELKNGTKLLNSPKSHLIRKAR